MKDEKEEEIEAGIQNDFVEENRPEEEAEI